MAATLITFNAGTSIGSRITQHLRNVRSGRNDLKDDLAVLKQMIDGDGSQIAQFDVMVQQCGFGGWVPNNAVTDAQRTAAQASWNELNSVSAKLNAPSGSGDSTGAAIDQACAKHGV